MGKLLSGCYNDHGFLDSDPWGKENRIRLFFPFDIDGKPVLEESVRMLWREESYG